MLKEHGTEMSFLTLCSLAGLHSCWNKIINCLLKDQNAIDFKCLPGHRAEEPDPMPKTLKESSELMVEKVGNREMNKEGKNPFIDN